MKSSAGFVDATGDWGCSHQFFIVWYYFARKLPCISIVLKENDRDIRPAYQASSAGWHEGENSYEPFVKYYLGIMLKVYNEFESRVEHLKYHNLSKPDRIKAVIDNKVGAGPSTGYVRI